MDMQYVISVGRAAIFTTFMVASPMLVFSLIIGLGVAIIQAITQIHEMTLTFIPKIIAVAVALVIFLPWMIKTLLSFTVQLLSMIPSMAY
ncbi:MAG: flagellar biosynthetic protein FliQ [candidate division Zixibacteria bacterium 4484_95]|nr:MAG: flagellar biosynthetic protein FliQ [candidate division Zixibacteria bacterium 4484_95]RKX19160.1 MAG: flagellar biosynthetic protein FliQ [candidate division Zixibacteria bacterium]